MSFRKLAVSCVVCFWSAMPGALASPARASDDSTFNVTSPQEMPIYLTVQNGQTDIDSIPMHRAMWGFFSTVLLQDDRDPGISSAFLVDSIGIPESDALALRDYIRTRRYEFNEFSSRLVRQECRKYSGRYATNEEFAETLKEIERQSDEKHKEALDDLRGVISHDSYQTLIAWIDDNIRPNITTVTTDYDLAMSQLGSRSGLERLCGRYR